MDINVKDEETGINSFWLACLYGHGHLMRVLAELGIDIFACNNNKINVLHLAVLKNHVQIVKMLCKSNFPIDLETSNGMTALHLAALHGNSEIADIIITHLVESQFKNAYVMESISKINDQINMSPLSLAILYGHEDIATKLITNGARCYFENNSMQKDLSPIFLACDKELTELLELMCDHGAQLQVQNASGHTPLMFASQQ